MAQYKLTLSLTGVGGNDKRAVKYLIKLAIMSIVFDFLSIVWVLSFGYRPITMFNVL